MSAYRMASTDRDSARRPLFEEILSGTLLYSLVLIGQRIAGVILLPVNTRFLTPSDYGVLELLEQVGVVLTLLVCANIPTALGYFYYQVESPGERHKVVSTALVGSALIGAAICACAALLVDPIARLAFGQPVHHFYLLILFTALPFSLALEVGFAWLRAANSPGRFAIAALLRVAVIIVGTIALVAGLKLKILGVLASNYVAIVIALLLLTGFFLRQGRLTFNWSLFTRLARFSIPLGLSTLAMFVINFGDRFLLPRYRPLQDLGIYGIAYKVGMLVSFLYASFHSYWSARVFEVVRRRDAEIVIARVFTYVALALSFCALGIVVLSRPVLGILTTPAFRYAAELVPLIVLAYSIRAVGDFFRCFFLVEARPHYDAVCNWLGALVCVAGYFLLIPRFGIWGAAAATALTFLLIGIVSVIWTYRMRRYRLEGVRLLKIGAVTAAMTALYFAMPVSSLVAQLTWAVALLAGYAALLWVLRFPAEGEIQAAWSVGATAIGRWRPADSRPTGVNCQ